MNDVATVQVRTARSDDRPAMRRIAATCFTSERVHRAGIVELLGDRPSVDPELATVAVAGGQVAGFLFASVPPGPSTATGYVDGWAVSPAHQRRGIGTLLLSQAQRRLSAQGCNWVQFGGTTWFYAWPGVDLAYTAALATAEQAGFTRQFLVHNMDVDLLGWLPPRSPAATNVRRGRISDGPGLDALIDSHFDPVWQHEVHRSLHRPTPTVHVAERDDRIVGFAAHGVYQPDLFGPLGTDPAYRSSGLGVALLHACLADMAAAGLPVAQIGWLGPEHFYANAANARRGRTFAVLRRSVIPWSADLL